MSQNPNSLATLWYGIKAPGRENFASQWTNITAIAAIQMESAKVDTTPSTTKDCVENDRQVMQCR